MRLSNLFIKGKTYDLPIFLPDATRAVTKSLDSVDLYNANVRGAVVNTFHLKDNPGIKKLQKIGGVKKLMNLEGLVVSDSGGWQVFSLIHRNSASNLPKGKITDEGVVFPIGKNKKEIFTPEISIQTQFAIGSDIVICLDDFTPPKSSAKKIKNSVDRTIYWAKRSKDEYDKLCKELELTEHTKPLILAVIQGGESKEMRKYCAQELIKIGFDGYGFGGYLIDENGDLDMNMMEYMANLVPENKFRFALGTGTPKQIQECYKLGWDIFDCTLPTRDARHQRLYIRKDKDFKEYEFLYINKGKFELDESPIDSFCDCHTCKHYSRAYLHHLFKIGDSTAMRLASIHNLKFYSDLIASLK